MSSSYSEDYHFVASLTFQVLELLAHFDDDLKLIWLKRSTWIKWNFLFMRYGSLCLGAVLTYQHIRASTSPYPESECYFWAVIRVFTPYLFMVGTQSVFISRVYTLYQGDWRVLVSLLLLFVAGFSWSVYWSARIFQEISAYTATCAPISYTVHPPRYVMPILFFTLDSVMLGLTSCKFIQLYRGPRRDPLLRLLLRDCSLAVAVVWGAYSLSLVLRFTNQVSALYTLVNTWQVSILSFTVTHLILNLRRLTERSLLSGVPESACDVYAGAFTSAIALDLPTLNQGRLLGYSTIIVEAERGKVT